jgi:uncharacterized membrane protein YkvA (DUF1232 family)
MTDSLSRDKESAGLELPNPITRRIGMFRSAWDRLILAFHLIKDDRVNLYVKAIPILTIAYLVSPIDFLPAIVTGPLGLLDDLTILIIGLNWFIQSAPVEIVREYMDQLEMA